MSVLRYVVSRKVLICSDSPGRFFAANELKALLTHVVMNYDVRFPDGVQGRPANIVSGSNVVPNPTAKVMFRRRKPVK